MRDFYEKLDYFGCLQKIILRFWVLFWFHILMKNVNLLSFLKKFKFSMKNIERLMNNMNLVLSPPPSVLYNKNPGTYFIGYRQPKTRLIFQKSMTQFEMYNT